MNKTLLHIVLFFCCISCAEQPETSSFDEKAQEMERTTQRLAVETTKVDSTVFQKQIMANGIVEALQKSELRFKISERISAIRIKNGAFVSKGTLLASLDNEVLKNLLDKAQIDLEKAKRNFIEEKINYGFTNVATDKIDPVKLKYMYLRSGYTEAKNTLESAQIRYNQTLLKAPFSGVIANLQSKTGDFVTSGNVFCIIINRKQLEVTFSVLESEIPFLEIDQKITITSFTNDQQNYEGMITEINPLVDENGLVNVKGTIQESATSLVDGMHVKILINKPLHNIIVVPRKAVVFREDKEIVFTTKNGKAQWNYVEILDENSKSYALQKGVTYGDTIIVSGNMNLSHNAKISPTFTSQKEENLR